MLPIIARTVFRIQEQLLGRRSFGILRELKQSERWSRQRLDELRLQRFRVRDPRHGQRPRRHQTGGQAFSGRWRVRTTRQGQKQRKHRDPSHDASPIGQPPVRVNPCVGRGFGSVTVSLEPHRPSPNRCLGGSLILRRLPRIPSCRGSRG